MQIVLSSKTNKQTNKMQMHLMTFTGSFKC